MEFGFYTLVTVCCVDVQSGGAFDIDGSSGAISVGRRLDREQRTSWELTVAAGNDGFPGTTTSVAVTVSVDDENDNSPLVRFPTSADHLLVQLARHAPLGTLVTRIDAHDPDVGQSLSHRQPGA